MSGDSFIVPLGAARRKVLLASSGKGLGMLLNTAGTQDTRQY